MKVGSLRGWNSGSPGRWAKWAGPGESTAIMQIAHSSPDRSGTGGIVESGEAGLPEHMGPEQGAGCSGGGLPAVLLVPPAVPSRIRWGSGMAPGPCDREVT